VNPDALAALPDVRRLLFDGKYAEGAKLITDKVMAQVEMQCGPFTVVSLMSADAVRELGLEPGSVAVAVVKATTVIVETTGGQS